jgi:ParB family chromosome partitioning protein
MDLRHLPLDSIDDNAFPRDRLALDPDALNLLAAAILADGLRQPVEVCAIPGPRPWGLIAGFRRMTALRGLEAQFPGRFATVAAVVRTPDDTAQALALMVSENDTRAAITPWEKGALILACVNRGLFPTPDAAVEALWPGLSRQGRSRLRGWAAVVEAFDGRLASPRLLSARRMDRLAAACRGGLAEVVADILSDHRHAGLETQWQAIAPALVEAVLTEEEPEPAPALVAPRSRRGPRPGRHRLTLPNGVKLRRELTPRGWILRLDGSSAAHAAIVEDILDLVERWYGAG